MHSRDKRLAGFQGWTVWVAMCREDDPVYLSKLTPEGESCPEETKYDCCAFVLFCFKHKKVAISRSSGAAWLPFTALSPGRSWTEGALFGALKVLIGADNQRAIEIQANLPVCNLQCMQMLRLQLPHTLKFITRLIYYGQIDQNNLTSQCCQDTQRLKWMSHADIMACNIENLWGPEVVEFSRMISDSIIQQVCEYSLDEAFMYVPREPPRNLEEAMLKSAHITEKDVERLYADFIDHCFPSFYQTLESFKCYMAKYGFEKNDNRLFMLFRAFNYNNNGFLSFHELLIGLATVEPNTMHGEARVRFIFRYYNLDGTGNLSENEFRKMIVDMNPGATLAMVDHKLNESFDVIGVTMVNGKRLISADDFICAVGSHRFRGTSSLCRSSKPIFTQIARTIAARALKKSIPRTNQSTFLKQFRGTCTVCKEKSYSLSFHSVKLNANGDICEATPITEPHFESTDILSSQRYSYEFVFNKCSPGNIFINLIHKFNDDKGTNKEPKGLLSEDPDHLWQLLMALYNDIDSLLDEEDKCARVVSPCYIIGDIHGNLEDLLTLEKSIWKRIPCVGANYVFLGDYVDRGQWGFECALYLMSFKTLAPNKVTMLRGNHEVRSLQKYYSYKKELEFKYGEELGLKVWEVTNKIFDKLPVAAVVDDAIFCAHGGIPYTAKTIDEINLSPRELSDPEREAPAAWEILWSDPCHPQQFIEMCSTLKLDPNETGGFVKNVKRGTAYQFNEVGAASFLEANGLTHIVRAHEVPQNGFTFHFVNKCITIFSSSHYCGNNNECACILADCQVLRVIHMDTVNNNPATS